MSPRPRGRTSSSDLKTRIIKAAWQQIALEGAPALSLRAIARLLNIAAPSIYNHFPDRDALVTNLIIEAFNSFGDFQYQAVCSIPEEDHAKRLHALGTAYREWAITYPERYQLIFGTPIAGYCAPIVPIGPSSLRSLSFLINVLNEANSQGRLIFDDSKPLSKKMNDMLGVWQNEISPGVEGKVLFLSLTIWTRVHGLVSIEIGNQYPLFITDAGEIFQCELENIVHQTIRLENSNV